MVRAQPQVVKERAQPQQRLSSRATCRCHAFKVSYKLLLLLRGHAQHTALDMDNLADGPCLLHGRTQSPRLLRTAPPVLAHILYMLQRVRARPPRASPYRERPRYLLSVSILALRSCSVPSFSGISLGTAGPRSARNAPKPADAPSLSATGWVEASLSPAWPGPSAAGAAQGAERAGGSYRLVLVGRVHVSKWQVLARKRQTCRGLADAAPVARICTRASRGSTEDDVEHDETKRAGCMHGCMAAWHVRTEAVHTVFPEQTAVAQCDASPSLPRASAHHYTDARAQTTHTRTHTLSSCSSFSHRQRRDSWLPTSEPRLQPGGADASDQQVRHSAGPSLGS